MFSNCVYNQLRMNTYCITKIGKRKLGVFDMESLQMAKATSLRLIIEKIFLKFRIDTSLVKDVERKISRWLGYLNRAEYVGWIKKW